jgi:hypothetical protein
LTRQTRGLFIQTMRSTFISLVIRLRCVECVRPQTDACSRVAGRPAARPGRRPRHGAAMADASPSSPHVPPEAQQLRDCMARSAARGAAAAVFSSALAMAVSPSGASWSPQPAGHSQPQPASGLECSGVQWCAAARGGHSHAPVGPGSPGVTTRADGRVVLRCLQALSASPWLYMRLAPAAGQRATVAVLGGGLCGSLTVRMTRFARTGGGGRGTQGGAEGGRCAATPRIPALAMWRIQPGRSDSACFCCLCATGWRQHLQLRQGGSQVQANPILRPPSPSCCVLVPVRPLVPWRLQQ